MHLIIIDNVQKTIINSNNKTCDHNWLVMLWGTTSVQSLVCMEADKFRILTVHGVVLFIEFVLCTTWHAPQINIRNTSHTTHSLITQTASPYCSLCTSHVEKKDPGLSATLMTPSKQYG